MVHQLIYRSVATKEFWPDDLFALIEKSRTNNESRDITGMLLFHEGQFLQLLEGPKDAVEARFEIVKDDPRHEQVEVLLKQDSHGRDFPEWTMGYERLDEAWHVPREWATILESDFTSDSLTAHPSQVRELLLSFRYTVA